MLSRLLVSMCTLLVLATFVAAQPAATAPASTQASVAVDQSTPRGALKLLMISMNKGDLATARGVFAPADEVETKMVDALLGQQQSMLKFRDAAQAAFGAEEARKLVGDVAGEEAKGLAML